MYIDDHTHDISFKVLKGGDVFRYRDQFFMVIQPVDSFNAVLLESGMLVEFSQDDIVKEVNATLQIEY